MRFKVFSAYTTIPEEFSIDTEVTEKDYDQYVETLKSISCLTVVAHAFNPSTWKAEAVDL